MVVDFHPQVQGELGGALAGQGEQLWGSWMVGMSPLVNLVGILMAVCGAQGDVGGKC
jgi:hypothetical protein